MFDSSFLSKIHTVPVHSTPRIDTTHLTVDWTGEEEDVNKSGVGEVPQSGDTGESQWLESSKGEHSSVDQTGESTYWYCNMYMYSTAHHNSTLKVKFIKFNS